MGPTVIKVKFDYFKQSFVLAKAAVDLDYELRTWLRNIPETAVYFSCKIGEENVQTLKLRSPPPPSPGSVQVAPLIR